MSSPVSTEAPRRRLSERQAQTVAALVEATVVELRAGGYDQLTVRNVARTAGVAPATAYNHFTSKAHLVTEVFWRRLAALPPTRADGRYGVHRRVSEALADLALLVADEPELAAACTVAMLANDPDVEVLRDRIGAAMHTRLADALGPDADPAVLRSLDLALTGALVHAGTGHLSYDQLPERLDELASLLLGGTR